MNKFENISAYNSFWDGKDIGSIDSYIFKDITTNNFFEILCDDIKIKVKLIEYNEDMIIIEKLKRMFYINTNYLLKCSYENKNYIILNHNLINEYIPIQEIIKNDFDNLSKSFIFDLRCNIAFKYLLGYRNKYLDDIYIFKLFDNDKNIFPIFLPNHIPYDFVYEFDNVLQDLNSQILQYFDNNSKLFVKYLLKVINNIDFKNLLKSINDIINQYNTNINLSKYLLDVINHVSEIYNKNYKLLIL